jgi:hypothetical protein
MEYREELIARIKDPSKWPAFERSDYLSELNGIADDAFLYDTVHGYLSAVLIYQQLAEEIVSLLIDCSQFFLQLSAFPVEIQFPKTKNRMFGQRVEDLSGGVEFPRKHELIAKCNELNPIRIDLVHRLTKRSSVEDLKCPAQRAKDVFDQLFAFFAESYDWFRLCYKDFLKDNDWDDLVDQGV